MAENVLHKTGARFNDSMEKVAEARSKLSEALEEGMDAASRTVKKGRYAAEELVDDAIHTVKQKPVQSVAVTFGVALGMGVLFGILIGRKLR